MKRSDIKAMPEYFDRYIKLVDDIELADAFKSSRQSLDMLDLTALKELGIRGYAAGKWSVKEIFQHLIDTERIFSYRTLRFARNDGTPLPGFDEKVYAAAAQANSRSLDDIINELKAVRTSSELLFRSFGDSRMHNVGISWNKPISVLAMGFTILGHQIHHLNVIENKYLPLLDNKTQVST
jgi:hypothetical protein